MLIVDAHEDLAYNILCFGRDYTRPVAETRRLEAGTGIPASNGDTLLGWPEYQRGQVAVVFGTLFASPARRNTSGWDTPAYADANEAHQLYSSQLDVYHRLADEHPDQFRLIQTRQDLQSVLKDWENHDLQNHPMGLVVLMEGAEGVRSPAELEEWWARGLRVIGPAWAGTRFCGGTREPGPLTPEGYALLEAMADLGFTLDISHMDEQAVMQALDAYPGPIIASHANAKSLLKGTDSNRFLSDRVIQGLLEREGMIGVVPLNSFLRMGWTAGDPREQVTLHHVVAQIDFICQMAGDARHAGLGSDFDGGFGVQSVPAEIDSIADLQKLVPLLREKGYSDQEIAGILGENWLNLLKRTLPESI
jgi:membrane dipeptidase